ncbi:MAG TPA: MFS transporter [Candidatus Saccharimonadales bacterium]|nr:MFS transporter [Candidatus Saccharimonadales bacterium]
MVVSKLKGKLEGKVLPIVLFTVFIDLLGVGILFPVIPQLLANPHSPFYLLPAGWTYKDGLVLLGFLTAIFPFMQFLATPILGQLSDRYGRKKILALSLAGTAVSYVVFAHGIIVRNIPLLFLARAFDGITGGNVAVAQAAIADVTAPEHRTRNFGLMGAVFGLGFILGPYIGGKLASPGVTLLHVGSLHLLTTPRWFNAATPFWFAAILSTINVTMVLVNFPETLKRVAHHLKIDWSRSFHNIIKAVTLPGLRTIFPSVFLFWGGFSFFTTFFSVYLTTKLGFKANNIGDFFAYIGLWIAITQGALTAILAKRLANWQVLRFSILGLSVALVAIFIPNNTTQLLLVAPLIPICVGLSIANITALVSRSAAANIQGEVLGINASVQALAQSIPAALTGYLGGISRNVPIIAASITVAVGGLLFWLLYRPSRQTMAHDPDPEMAAGH